MSRPVRVSVLLSIVLVLLTGSITRAQTDFTADVLSGCAPLGVNFNGTSSSTVTSWTWTISGPTGSATITGNPAGYLFSTPGVYSISLTINGTGGTTVTKSSYITVNDTPSVTFTASPTTGCVPLLTQFTSTVASNPLSPGPLTYSWDFGDGDSGGGANPSHTYTTASTYPVSVTVTNSAGCDATKSVPAYITVNSRPVPGFTVSQTSFCIAPASVTFTSTSFGGRSPYTTFWRFGDNTTGTGGTTTHSYTSGGSFNPTIIVTDANGCVDSVTPLTIVVNTAAATISSKDSVCVAQEITFTNTTSGAGATTWDFDDGNLANGSTVTHTYQSSGTYIVKMGTVIGGCTKPATKTIVVNPKPNPVLYMVPPIPCPAPVTVDFIASGTVPATYAWSWKSGGSAAGDTVKKTYTANIPDEAKVIATSAVGCQDSAFMTDIMIRGILVGITPGGLCDDLDHPYAGCVPLTVNFGVDLYSTLPAPPVPCGYVRHPLSDTAWLWDFGDGSPLSTAANPIHTYTAIGDYVVTCSVWVANNPAGCAAVGQRAIHVDVPVKPSFTGSPLTICPKDTVTFLNTTASPMTKTTYSWFVFDYHLAQDDTVVQISHTNPVRVPIKRPGTYSVRLISNHAGCVDSIARYDYITVHPPGVKFSSFVECAPSTTVVFTNNSSNSTSQVWNFGDGNTSTAHSPRHTYAATGTYKVRLRVHNSTYGCYDEDSAIIQVFDPNLDFITRDDSICTGDYTTVKALFRGTGAVSYSWIFGSYQTSFSPVDSMEHPFTTAGYYDVTLITQSGNNCFDTVRKVNEILVSRPVVAFDGTPVIGCQPLAVQFTDNSTNTPSVNNVRRLWTFGDGNQIVGTTNTASNTYFASGIYSVKLRVEDGLGCADSLTRNNYISVNKPDATFTASDDSVCAHEPVRFVSNSRALTMPIRHHWDFGDNTTDTGYRPVHRYTDTGLFTVRLIVTDAVGCSDTMTLPYQIMVDAPFADFYMSDSVSFCKPPFQVRFTDTSVDAVSWHWNFGTGAPPVLVKSPVTTFNSIGVFPIYLVVTNANGCRDTARDTIHILGYDGALSYTPLDGCAPMKVQFNTPINNVPEVTWYFGDGATTKTFFNSTTSYTYTTAGTYVPSVIFYDGKCTSPVSRGLDTIRVDKLDADFTWTTPCMGAPFTLTQTSTALFNNPSSWAWYFSGGSDTAAGPSASYTYPTGGPHAVTLVAANPFGCKDTITKNVLINFLPEIRATDDTGVCPKDRVDLVVKGGLSYTWSPAPDSLSNPPVFDTAHVHLDSGAVGTFKTYYVSGTDANGCINKDSVTIRIQLRTDYTIGQGGEICVGDTFRLHAQGAHSYEWMPASTIDSPFIGSPLARPERTTTYIVAAREGSCDVDSQRVTVVVRSLPLFSAGADEVIPLGGVVTLKPTQQGITRIEWQADTTLSCVDCFRPNAHPYFTRTYYATGYNEYGCQASDSVTVHVRCNGSMVFIPNSFSPNGDGTNDYFFPRGEGLDRMSTFRVFNRWGELVFERSNVSLNDERAGWDGTYKGVQLPPDVYVYTMQSRCRTGEVINWKGDITLIR